MNSAAALLGAAAGAAEVAVEILSQNSQSRSVAWADGKPSVQENALSEGVCLRVLIKNRQGLVTTRSTKTERMAELRDRAVASAHATPPDPHRKFGEPASSKIANLKIDDRIFGTPLNEQLARLADLEKAILRVDGRVKKVVKLALTETLWRREMCNTLGAETSEQSTASSVMAEVLAEDAGDTEVAWDYQAQRFSNSLSLETIAESVARRAASAIGARPLPSGKYPVVVEPRVGAQLLGLVANAVSAEAVQRGRSFYAGRLGENVAAPAVTIVDDPSRVDGIASARYDDEGTPHERLTIINNGVLSEFFYDLCSASKEGRRSNGHGLKQSLGALPRPASTNFYMEPGSAAVRDMLAGAGQVFLLKEVMGLHMADPITGEFSLGASGGLYENGRFARPVRGVTIASDIATMLQSISAVGDDLTWYGSTGSPSFFLPSMTIAGN